MPGGWLSPAQLIAFGRLGSELRENLLCFGNEIDAVQALCEIQRCGSDGERFFVPPTGTVAFCQA